MRDIRGKTIGADAVSRLTVGAVDLTAPLDPRLVDPHPAVRSISVIGGRQLEEIAFVWD